MLNLGNLGKNQGKFCYMYQIYVSIMINAVNLGKFG